MYQKQAEITYFHYILRHKGRHKMDLGKSNPPPQNSILRLRNLVDHENHWQDFS